VAEQAAAATQITTAAHSMKQQAEQVSKATNEQAKAARDMTAATENISKEVGLITRSNRQHLSSSGKVLGTLTEIRQITERNGRGVEATLSVTTNLNEMARRLIEMTGGEKAGGSSGNGTDKSVSGTRLRKKSGARRTAAAQGQGSAGDEVSTD